MNFFLRLLSLSRTALFCITCCVVFDGGTNLDIKYVSVTYKGGSWLIHIIFLKNEITNTFLIA